MTRHYLSGDNSDDDADRKPPRATPLPARAWLIRARDEEARFQRSPNSPPDLWCVLLEPPVPAAGQELSVVDAQRKPEQHYGSRPELEAMAAAYGVTETYIWSPDENTYRLLK